MRFHGLILRGVAIGLLAVPRLLAQCPDGTPPPCRAGVPAAAPRRANPPLDERTWIVVPFENVTRTPDIDWLRDASVNLLYLDMSRWRDIKVIDDERVADLIRDVPEAQGAGQLTLQRGLAVARRAGAGRMVMGDLLKVGARTQVVGKVFDVRTGQRVRTVRQEAPQLDSIIPAFGRLARAVLNVEPPPGAGLGAIGSTSVGAYQAYIAGIGYLNRWIFDSARVQFDRALQMDSSFALAHYKLALVYGWEAPGSPEGQRHAELAQQLGTPLPPRERSLVAGYAAFASRRYAEACDVFSRMLQADSSDVEAWYNLGECSYHDLAIVRQAGDSTRLAFRGSWNLMLRAFRRVLELDPSYHLAFQHIQDGLLSATRTGCLLPPGETQCVQAANVYQAVLRRAGDSLLIVPVNILEAGGAEWARQNQAAFSENARRLNLEEARRAAEEWLAAGPNEVRPRIAYARILLRLGDLARADATLRGLRRPASRVEATGFLTDRIELAAKLGQLDLASTLADSVGLLLETAGDARSVGAVIQSIFGRTARLSAMVEQVVQSSPAVKHYFGMQTRAVAGVPVDSLFEAEAALGKMAAAAQGVARSTTALMGSLVWSDPRDRHGSWPPVDTLSGDPRIQLASFLAGGDTLRIRVALAHFDSLSSLAAARRTSDAGYGLAGAYAHLMIADTAGALASLRRFRDSTWASTPITEPLANGFVFAGMLWARTFRLLGDLAAATGRREEAAQAYQLFIGFWQHGDPDVGPELARVRAALAALGG